MTSTSIIIPVHNQCLLTERCLRGLGDEHAEVVVVDDASTDQTAQVLAGLAPRVKAIQHTTNRGFATSCNHGAAASSGEFLVFLNNDTVPRPGWLDALVGYAMSHPEVSVVGSKLVYPDDTIQHAGVVICQDHYPRHIYTGFPADHPAVSKSRPFQVVTGACMLVRRATFEQIGGFDPSFRNGFEDVDFCLRVRKAGLEVHYCAQSVVEHLESVSPGRFRHAGKNVARYRQRWFGRVQPDDVKYYLEDGLLQFSYEGSFPIGVTLSPRLGILNAERRGSETEELLVESTRRIAQLRRENIRLGLQASNPDSETAQYDTLRRRIHEIIQHQTQPGTTVLVISKGDGALLESKGRSAWHFPQTETGVYAGYHPATSEEAIKHLETLRRRGGNYLLIPATSLWWLDYYAEFRKHLETHYHRLSTPNSVCVLYGLDSPNEGTDAVWQAEQVEAGPSGELISQDFLAVDSLRNSL